jgi:PilZ domain
LQVPVTLRNHHRSRIEGHLINVSQGGLQIYTDDPVEPTQPLRVSLELPGAKHVLKAEAEIAWQDQRGNIGIRFVKLAPHRQRSLRLWLAQQYFAN